MLPSVVACAATHVGCCRVIGQVRTVLRERRSPVLSRHSLHARSAERTATQTLRIGTEIVHVCAILGSLLGSYGVTLNHVASIGVAPRLEQIDSVDIATVRNYYVRRLYVLIETRVAVGESVPHILAATALIARVGIGYRLAVLHKEHVYSVLRHVFVMCCDVLVVVATVHQYAVNILLEEDDTRNVGQVLSSPHLAIARCRRILRTII